MTFNPSNWYWVAADTSPGTQVWQSATGAFVANSTGLFATWLAQRFPEQQRMLVSASVNDGTGKIKLTVNGSRLSTTNEVMYYIGNNSGGLGTFAITVNDGTHVTLQGSTFTVADTSGTLYGATVIDTAANIYAEINNLNKANASNYNNEFTLSGSGGSTQFAPFYFNVLRITNTSVGAFPFALPEANLIGSAIIGLPIFIICESASANGITVTNHSGGAQIGSALNPGDMAIVFLIGNSTSDGAWDAFSVPMTATVDRGGTGVSGGLTQHAVLLGEGLNPISTASVGTAGRVLVDQGASADPAFTVISGDVTLSSGGVIAGAVPVNVSVLPAAGTAGRRRMVNNANSTTFQTIAATGGANIVPVYDDGTNWRIG